MNLLKTNIENLADDKRMLYRLTKARGVNVKDLDADSEHPVDVFLLYEGENSKSEIQTVLSILSGDLKIQTISKTFISAFLEIAELMGDDAYSLKIIKSTTKAGREFVSCELA